MRLQRLILVIVSLRSSESERRWCGFTPRGGKHGRGQWPLTDSRFQGGEQSTTNQRCHWPAHHIHINQLEPARGGTWMLCCASNVGLRSDRPRWGGGWGKVTQERRNSWCCWCTDGRRGELYFAINRIVENLWPQTAPDQLSVESFWSGLWAFQSWIYPTAAAKCWGRFGRYAATNAGVFSTTPAPGPNFFNFLMDPLGNTPETPRFELLLKFFKQFC